jgi:hypothetical protein
MDLGPPAMRFTPAGNRRRWRVLIGRLGSDDPLERQEALVDLLFAAVPQSLRGLAADKCDDSRFATPSVTGRIAACRLKRARKSAFVTIRTSPFGRGAAPNHGCEVAAAARPSAPADWTALRRSLVVPLRSGCFV